MRSTDRRSARGGFTLIEVAVATLIIAIGLTALMVAVASNTRVNDAGKRLAQGVFLAEEFREWTVANPGGLLTDLGGGTIITYNSPIDANGDALTGMTGWSDRVTLTYRDPNCPSQLAAGTTDTFYIDLDVRYKGQSIVNAGWLQVRRDEP